MDENFPVLKKETDIQVQEEKRVPKKMKPTNPRHIYISQPTQDIWLKWQEIFVVSFSFSFFFFCSHYTLFFNSYFPNTFFFYCTA